MSFRNAAAAVLSLFFLVFAIGSGLHAQTEVRVQLDRVRTEITALDRDVQANLNSDKGLVDDFIATIGL